MIVYDATFHTGVKLRMFTQCAAQLLVTIWQESHMIAIYGSCVARDRGA